MNSTLLRNTLLAATLFSTSVLSIAQTVVYDNTDPTHNLGQFYPSLNEYGDEITLSAGPRTLNQFSFYYHFSGAAGSANGVLRLYQANGTGGAPGTLLYDGATDPFTLQNGDNTETINFGGVIPPITIPGTLIWTIQFANLGANQAGLLVYGPPTTGNSFNDFWEKTGGTWGTQVLPGGVLSDFAARLTAVPEPSPLAVSALALVAGAGLAGYRKLRQ